MWWACWHLLLQSRPGVCRGPSRAHTCCVNPIWKLYLGYTISYECGEQTRARVAATSYMATKPRSTATECGSTGAVGMSQPCHGAYCIDVGGLGKQDNVVGLATIPLTPVAAAAHQSIPRLRGPTGTRPHRNVERVAPSHGGRAGRRPNSMTRRRLAARDTQCAPPPAREVVFRQEMGRGRNAHTHTTDPRALDGQYGRPGGGGGGCPGCQACEVDKSEPMGPLGAGRSRPRG